MGYYCCLIDSNIDYVGRIFSISYGASPYAVLIDAAPLIESQISELITRHYEEVNLMDPEEFVDEFPELGIDPEEFDSITVQEAINDNIMNHCKALKEIAPQGRVCGLWYNAFEFLRGYWDAYYCNDSFEIPFEGPLPRFVPALISYVDCNTADGVFDFSIGRHQAVLRRIIRQEKWTTDDALVRQILQTFRELSNELDEFT
jgi:hypothetical protein